MPTANAGPEMSVEQFNKIIGTDRSLTPETMEEQAKQKKLIESDIIAIKELRRDIDVQIQKVKKLKASREGSITITKLQEAVMWLGMNLKAINERFPGIMPNPYPNSKDPSNTKIDPTADGLKL